LHSLAKISTPYLCSAVAHTTRATPPGRRASYIVLDAVTASFGRQMMSAVMTMSAEPRPRPHHEADVRMGALPTRHLTYEY
jgi:hypothetical protein